MITGNVHDIHWILKDRRSQGPELAKAFFAKEYAQNAHRFHQQLPGYQFTDLVGLPKLSELLGVGGIWTKDESQRLGLNSFKSLGGSFALYRYLQKQLGILGEDTPFSYLASKEVKEKVGDLVFASATDGNHGRGVAWAATQLGFSSIIYVHKDTSIRRIEAIESAGAKVVVIDGTYDDAVRQVALDSDKNGWVVISDTSWDGYTEVPTWIMQGYLTLLTEAQEQFGKAGIAKPTHVIVQAGVGALAAAVIGHYHALFGDDAPLCYVLEPEKAQCLYQSALADDGKPRSVGGDLDTLMAGLACGDPSPLAWEVIDAYADGFIVIPDELAAKGMRIYASPIPGDSQVKSGESGAGGLGLLATIMGNSAYAGLREQLGLDETSQVLFISSEGDTDPVHYKEIVWEGSSPVSKQYYNEY